MLIRLTNLIYFIIMPLTRLTKFSYIILFIGAGIAIVGGTFLEDSLVLGEITFFGGMNVINCSFPLLLIARTALVRHILGPHHLVSPQFLRL